MLNSLIKTYDLYHSTGEDNYGQANEHVLVNTVDIAISDLTHTIDRSNPMFTNSTHLGLTNSNEVNMGDILKLDGKEFQVEYVILETRLTQLFLKKV